MNPDDIRNGHVETDNQSDTHGFTRTEKEAWVSFRGLPHSLPLLRDVWVDYLGDYWVLGIGEERFERLDWGDAVTDYRLVIETAGRTRGARGSRPPRNHD